MTLDLPITSVETKPNSKISAEPPVKAIVRVVPNLEKEKLQRAYELAGQLDPSNARNVLTFGEDSKALVADLSESLSDHLKATGFDRAESLLGQAITIVKANNPTLPQAPTSFWAKLLGSQPSMSEAVTEFADNHEAAKPSLTLLEKQLELERASTLVCLEQLEDIRQKNRAYLEALQIDRAALILVNNRAAEEYNESRSALTNSDDTLQVGDVRLKWQGLQRLDRRIYALDLSLALAAAHDGEIDRQREMLTYNAEALGETCTTMLPAWGRKIRLLVTALKADDQVKIVEALRQLTDNLHTEAGDLIARVENSQANMQKRTFIAAEVIVKVNNQMADAINQSIENQIIGKKARDEGLKSIQESQLRVLEAMRRSDESLLNSSATPAIGIRPVNSDISASLLKEDVKRAVHQ